MNIYDVLNKLNISYEEVEHPAVFTIKEAQKIERQLDGVGCKNLFLKNKDRYYIYVLRDNMMADLKDLANVLGESHLRFGNEEELMSLLGLIKGSVTPLGIINDKDNKVKLVFDKELVNKKLLCHPNINTKTISIEYDDLIKLVENEKHEFIVY